MLSSTPPDEDTIVLSNPISIPNVPYIKDGILHLKGPKRPKRIEDFQDIYMTAKFLLFSANESLKRKQVYHFLELSELKKVVQTN